MLGHRPHARGGSYCCSRNTGPGTARDAGAHGRTHRRLVVGMETTLAGIEVAYLNLRACRGHSCPSRPPAITLGALWKSQARTARATTIIMGCVASKGVEFKRRIR